VNGDSLKPS